MFKIILFLNTSIYILFFFVVSMNVSLLMCFIEFFEHDTILLPPAHR